jgi:hypothetical protein
MDYNNSSNVILFRPKKSFEMPVAQQGISRTHLMMLAALTDYAAYFLKIERDTVYAMVLTTFRIRSYEQLQEEDFERTLQYIVYLLEDHATKQ